jgi:hypothetical protein
VLGVAADFRYAYWCVLATLAGAMAVVLAQYDRRERAEARASPIKPTVAASPAA